MKKFFLLFLHLLLVTYVFPQAAPITAIGTLASVINESSGIEQTAPNVFFTHNDSGGQPDIYKIDSSGTLLKTIKITNATNVDWEDIAKDDSGYVYVGDFGNNNNNRSAGGGNGLRIYKVNNPGAITGTTAVAGIINFEYADRNFSAPASNHNFDMEGFFFFGDSLHLFTKNRTSPTNGWIKHYKLPVTPGTFTATLVDSFNNGGIRITSADISPNKKTVALLAENRIYLFYCYKGSKFISTGSNTVLTIPQTQKEAIVWVNDSTVFITEEGSGGKVFRSNLKSFIYKPVPVSISSPTIVCSGNTLTLTAGPATSFTWSTGSNSLSISVSPTISTTYSVTATDSKGCVSSTTKSISVNPLPVVTASSNPFSGIICAGASITMSGSGALSYTWTGGITDAVAFTPTAGSTYTVTGTDGNGCKNSAIKSISINPLPTVNISTTYSIICNGQTTTLTANGALSYTWNTTATTNSIVESPTTSTTYSVNGTDTNGCSNSMTANITVNALPTLSIALTNTAICVGQNATLTVSGANTYSWNTASTNTSIVVSPINTTTYSVVGMSSVTGCTNSIMQTLNINSLPTLAASTSNSIICGPPYQQTCTITASGASTYTWNTSANSNSIAVSPSVTTQYTVTGTDTNGCSNSTIITQSVSACTELSENSVSNSEFNVYPNPTNGILIIRVLETGGVLKLFNQLGEILLEVKIINQETTVDLTNFASGVYFIILGKEVKKIIKQ